MAIHTTRSPIEQERILAENPERFVMFPIQYPTIWQLYKVAQASLWTAEEIDLGMDVIHWTSMLNAKERSFIGKVLAFFAASDGIVVENLAQRFCAEVTIPEACSFYSFQMAMENVHSETYSLILSTLINNENEREHLFRGIETIPAIKAKAEWTRRWTEEGEQPFASRIIAFAAVEGIFFSSSFAAIFWLRSKGVMPGLCHSNDLISRDEGLHTSFACILHGHLRHQCNKETVYRIVREAVELEKQFFHDALPEPLLGINANLMDDYIEVVGDFLLRQLGFPPLFLAKNPFPFMDLILLDGKNNFFERRVSEYHRPDISYHHGGRAESAGDVNKL
ncbi:putative ribonucleoside-diphosphate reductase small chain B [Panus rudis PR-1116 ss-1]|nr:putative ribonucleoside-diphosphate reductase small chain B [Panus rudis PR-1116 ss-1]